MESSRGVTWRVWRGWPLRALREIFRGGVFGGGGGGIFGAVARCGLEEKGWEGGEVGAFEGVVGFGS